MKKLFITTPIYYPNARPHVGSAYTTIVCDALARYKRMGGYDVAFLTGTDEHGEKLARAAEAAGMSPAAFVAEKRELFKNLWRTLGIPEYGPENPAGYRFVHTSQNPDHVKSVHWMIRQAQKAGYIAKKKYEGRYCIYDERYVSDSSAPVNCDICGRPAELISEENYFFKLSAFQDRLLKLYEDRPEFVLPDFRMNEVKSFVKSGLRDISISRRRLKWGIPWPDDPEQVVYVWYDALTSYLTGIGFRGADKPEPDFETYWMDPDAERVHMIGKDILRFHAVYWPAFLMAANDALPNDKKLQLPTTIFAHGWIYYQQDKMSKSKGNVVYPEPIVEALNSFGAPGNDALRYYLLRDTPLGQDASFSYEGLIRRYNSDLANDLGNLANRTITMLLRYSNGVAPAWLDVGPNPRDQDLRVTFFGQAAPDFLASEPGLPSAPNHAEIAAKLGLPAAVATNYKGVLNSFREAFERCDFSNALANVLYGVYKANLYLGIDKPWSLPSSDPRLAIVLYRAADLLRTIAVVVCPVLPQSAERLWEQLGCEGNVEDQSIQQLNWGGLRPGTKVGKPEPIFPRLDKAAALARLNEFAERDRGGETPPRGISATENSTKEGGTVEQQPEEKPNTTSQSPSGTGMPPVIKDTAKMAVPQAQAPTDQKISIDDFAKVEMRVGEVVSAERIPKADKLLKLMVDIGTEIRQVCAGIAEYYEPEQLVGMKVVVVTNLQPRKMRGVESNGMIVAASAEPGGKPVLATFAEDVPKGAKLK